MSILPTWSLGSGMRRTIFRDELTHFLDSDTRYNQINMYFYAVTQPGWDLIWPSVQTWMSKRSNRKINVYCGISNWLSDPSALAEMMRVFPRKVWIVKRGHGVFHPKAYIFRARNQADCFIGSNNLTRPGMTSNFELGARLTLRPADDFDWKMLVEWESKVRSISTPLTKDLLAIYEEEYLQMKCLPRDHSGVVGKSRVRLQAAAASAGLPAARSAIMEVMPRETGTGGSQLQIPKQVAIALFGLPPGGQRSIRLRDVETNHVSHLTFTDYGNSTRRLSIGRLTQVPRPRIIWFNRANGGFEFNIVSRAINPSEYERLLSKCLSRTSPNSKRWGMYEEALL